TTSAGLQAALQNAQPGDTIHLASGTYPGRFTAMQSGTADNPICLIGLGDAVLDGGNPTAGYGLYLNQVDYWVLQGFTVTNSRKGIMLDESNHNILDHLVLYGIGEEAVHFRLSSSTNVIQESQIHDTGLLTPGVGEGVYIGSAVSHWAVDPDDPLRLV